MIRHATQHDLVEKPRQPRRLSVLEESARTDPPSAPAIHSEKLLRVGDLAQETGKTVRAIRLYEELGLLRPRSRSHGQQRLFGSDAVVRTRWISKLQQLGMSLNDIRSVVLEWETLSAPGAMSRMREMYRKRLDETRAHLERLCVLERELAASLQYIESCDACDPDRLVSACQQCDMRACDETQPDLVAGLSAHIEPMLGQAGMDASSCAGTERSG